MRHGDIVSPPHGHRRPVHARLSAHNLCNRTRFAFGGWFHTLCGCDVSMGRMRACRSPRPDCAPASAHVRTAFLGPTPLPTSPGPLNVEHDHAETRDGWCPCPQRGVCQCAVVFPPCRQSFPSAAARRRFFFFARARGRERGGNAAAQHRAVTTQRVAPVAVAYSSSSSSCSSSSSSSSSSSASPTLSGSSYS